MTKEILQTSNIKFIRQNKMDFKGLIFQKYNFDDFTRRQKNNRILPGQAGTGENISRMFVDVIPSQLRGLR